MRNIICLFLLVFSFTSCQNAQQHLAPFVWTPYSKKALEDSIAHHKPVVIDFFAEWCPNCHEMDRVVFTLPQIQAKLAQVTTLRMDVTDQEDPEVQKIAQEYGIEGVPTVIFLDSHGKEIENSRVIGFVTPEDFAQSLALFKIFK